MSELFPGFTTRRVATSGAEIHCVVGGRGPPLLLLHGYPQTHAIWHRVAPRFAERYTVVCSDLRGYGDSSKPQSDDRHVAYSKRAMARDQVELMEALGLPRFKLAGHDRGGRVAHRLCLDHPQAVERVAVLDISPTRAMYDGTDMAFATAYYHWFFLIQPFDLPERLIGADPLYYLRRKLGGWGSNLSHFDPRAMAEYERCYSDPATIHATCEDYRAAATIDLEHDRADLDRRIDCPMLALWGAKNRIWRKLDVLAMWRERARDVTGEAMPTGHYLAEEAPEETAAKLLAFLAG